MSSQQGFSLTERAQRVTPRRNSGQTISLLLALAIVAFGIFALVYTIRIVIQTYTPILYWDHWQVVDLLRPGQLTIGNLWAQHNEHRYFIGTLLAVLDILWFHGQSISLHIEIFLIAAAHFLVFAWAIRRFGHFPRLLFISFLGFLLYCLFSPLQIENFVWPYQAGFVLVACAATTSFVCAAWYSTIAPSASRRRAVAFSLCLFSALIAEASLANGVLVWPLLLFIGLTLGFSKRDLLIVLACGIVAITAYMAGYHSPPYHSNPADSLQHPAEVLKYVITYLGSSWDGEIPNQLSFPAVSESLTFLAIIAVLTGAASCLRKWRTPSPLRSFLYTNAVFIVGSAVLTAFGRLKFGYEEAAVSRYQLFALIFWACLAALGASYLSETRPNWRWIAAAQTGVLVLLIASGSRYSDMAQPFFARKSNLLQAYDALRSGDLSNPVLLKMYHHPNMLPEYLAILRAHRAQPAYTVPEKLEANMSQYHVLPEDACLGYVDRAAREGGPGYAVAGGWAWDLKYESLPERIVVADPTGAIEGWTQPGGRRPDVRRDIPRVKSDSAGWNLSFHTDGPGPYCVYALLGHNHSACRIGKEFTLH
jgi:hypothetical protein